MLPAFAALDAAVALFKRFRTLIALAPFIALCAFLWVKLYGFLWWDGAIEQRDKARAQVVQMEAASKEARAKQIALNQAVQAKYETLAEKADHAHAIELADARSRAAAYASRNGVRSYCQSSAGQASSAPEGPVAPRDNGPGADAVILNRDDFDQLVENTLRLKAAHEWGESLVKDGVAVVYPEPKLSGD